MASAVMELLLPDTDAGVAGSRLEGLASAINKRPVSAALKSPTSVRRTHIPGELLELEIRLILLCRPVATREKWLSSKFSQKALLSSDH